MNAANDAVFVPDHHMVRALLVLPFLLIFASAGALVVAGIAAWGAAAEVDYPDWAPAYGAVVFAGPLLVLSPLLAVVTWRHTGDPFRMDRTHLIVSLVCFAACIALTISYIITVE